MNNVKKKNVAQKKNPFFVVLFSFIIDVNFTFTVNVAFSLFLFLLNELRPVHQNKNLKIRELIWKVRND